MGLRDPSGRKPCKNVTCASTHANLKMPHCHADPTKPKPGPRYCNSIRVTFALAGVLVARELAADPPNVF